MAYGEKGDHDQAITNYTAAIELNPKVGYAFYTRGYSYLRKGDKANAKADFAQAKKLGYKAEPSRSVLQSCVHLWQKWMHLGQKRW